ncbi:MAG: glycoside hydrolase family 130 protein [Acidobacteriota bacterium]|nr:glycoside hydrolase family 130 protein [Acidobacteriota bacterium]
MNRNCFALLPCVLAALAFAGPKADWTLGPFHRPPDAGPLIAPNPVSIFQDPLRNFPVHWEALHTFNPAAVVRDGKVYVLYRAEDDSGEMAIGGHTSRLGLAVSDDGIHFRREAQPVFYPANDDQKSREWEGGCEDPRIVESGDGAYVLTYTQWNRTTYDVGVATSRDLHHWTKHGPALAKAYGGKYAGLKYKSAGIVTKLSGGRLIAARINGKYWMYWGEGQISLATSGNLIDWEPVEDSGGRPVALLEKRPGHFDSFLPEVGPPPVLTARGIVMIYNGKNAEIDRDPKLAPSTYSAGQALFSANNPAHLLARLDEPFFQPELPFERSGQYAAGTTFAEGLVFFQRRWFLYYGCADSLVGMAFTSPKK